MFRSDAETSVYGLTLSDRRETNILDAHRLWELCCKGNSDERKTLKCLITVQHEAEKTLKQWKSRNPGTGGAAEAFIVKQTCCFENRQRLAAKTQKTPSRCTYVINKLLHHLILELLHLQTWVSSLPPSAMTTYPIGLLRFRGKIPQNPLLKGSEGFYVL